MTRFWTDLGAGLATDAIESIGDSHHLDGRVVFIFFVANFTFDQFIYVARTDLETTPAADAASLVHFRRLSKRTNKRFLGAISASRILC